MKLCSVRYLGVVPALLVAGVLASATAPARAGTEEGVRFGGGVRFQYGWRDYGPTSTDMPELVQV